MTDAALGLKDRIAAIAKNSNHGKKYTREEMMDIQKKHSEAASKEAEERKLAASEKRKSKTAELAIGRSGIQLLHQSCTVSNFEANTHGKKLAKQFSFNYVTAFSDNNGQGFIFAGSEGTGKNHLSAAICNALIKTGKSCLIITITELMQKLRNTYRKDSEVTEDQFIQSMFAYDLLVLDEVGLQKNTESEVIAINQIVDQRLVRLKPTGMLTNLGSNDLKILLGARVMDRMSSNKGAWVEFNWESYRR